jgi:acetate---CoA ligase (ADP-forming)
VTRDLRALFDPRTVAVVGASNDPGKWGHWLARGALRGEERRSVFLVNRNGSEVLGRQTFRSLADLPDAPDLVVLSVPAAGFEEAVESSLAAGARAIVVISAGLGESGPDGRERERAVVERVRAAGAVLLGPNCLGVFDADTRLDLSSNAVPAGEIGLVSQSGNLALEVGLLGADVGLGFSRFVSLGNQADLEAAELLEDFGAHEKTRAIAVYCEDFRDGRAFARAARSAIDRGKPVVLIAGGATEASAGAALSHTGALASDLAAVDAACRAVGIERVSSPKELVDLLSALLAGRRPRGRRIALAGDGGGHSVIAADLVAAHGLELPPLSAETQATLTAILPATATTSNPVDLAGGGEQDIANFDRVITTLLESGDADTVLLTGYFGGYSEYATEFRDQEVAAALGMVRAAERTERPLLVHTMYWQSPPAQELRDHGVPVYRDVEGAIWAASRLAAAGELVFRDPPELPLPADPPLDSVDYWRAREVLAAAGVEFAPALAASDAAGAVGAAAELGYPVVVKALGRLHKSEGGGVAVGLRDAREVETVLAKMATTLSPSGYSVERMAPLAEGIELIVGARRDPRFGPLVLVGAGGLYAEVLADVAVALAPVGEDEAEDLVRSLRATPLLTGARGRPPLDVVAAARAAAALSRVAAERPEIAELEINPLLVTPDGALGLDARVVLREKGEDDAR